MSRSTYTWVVTEVESKEPVAAFTVKHELAHWQIGRWHEDYVVWRFRFFGQLRVRLDWSTLEPVQEQEEEE